MATPDLHFVQLRVTTQEMTPETRRWVPVDPPQPELVVATQSGRTRVIPLSSKDMARLFTQAATIIGNQLHEETRR
jgi:hypothetical protein